MNVNLCTNTLLLIGEDKKQGIELFKSLDKDSPPFFDIKLLNEKIEFTSKSVPPIKTLNILAELYNLSYQITYKIHRMARTGSYIYQCLHHRTLSPFAEELRMEIIDDISRQAMEAIYFTMQDLSIIERLDIVEQCILLELLMNKYYSQAYIGDSTLFNPPHALKIRSEFRSTSKTDYCNNTHLFLLINHITMKKIFQKIDQIRATGRATLNVGKNSGYYHLNGKKFAVVSYGTPDIKCRITLMIDNKEVDFNINDIL